MKTPNTLPVKAFAASLVAANVLALAGCSPPVDAHRTTETAIAELKESGNAVDSDNAMSTPADKLANDLVASRRFKKSLFETGVDAATLEADAETNKYLASGKLVAAAQASTYFENVLAGVRSDRRVTRFDASDAGVELGRITDTETRSTMKAYTDSKVTEAALYAVRYGTIEPDEARKVLDGLGLKNRQEIEPLLDQLDAGGNAIHNYSSPQAIRADAADITNNALKKLLEQQAEAIETNDSMDDSYGQLVDIYDEAEAKVDGLSANMPDLERAVNRLRSGEGAEIEYQSAVAGHNAISAVDDFNGLRTLDDPGKVIDMTGVTGQKLYVDQLDGTKPVENEFAEVYAENGRPVIKFVEGNGLKRESIDQLTQLTEDVMPLIESGMQKGDIVAIRFVVDAQGYNPYFHPSSKEIHMVLPADASMSEDQFRTGILHEATHALVGSAFSIEGQVTDEEAVQVKNACQALSTQAYDMFEDKVRESSMLVDNLITTAQTDQDRKVFVELKNIFDTEKVIEIMADASMSEWDINKYDIGTTMCAADKSNFATLVTKAAFNADVKDYQNTANDILDRYVIDYKAADGSDLESDYEKVIGIWVEATDEYSIWSRLNEAAYVITESDIKGYLGHSEDNATEMMATVADVTLHAPDQVKAMMRGLTPKDRDTVRQSIAATYTILSNRHPNMKPYLEAHRKQFEAGN